MTTSSQAANQKWIEYYLPLAESGDPMAQIAVGWEYHRGKLFEKNIEEAERWFRKAENAVGELATFQRMKMLHIENERRIENVFVEKGDWALGAIYMIYGCDLIDRGKVQQGKQMLSVAVKKGNLYAGVRLDQISHSGIRKLLVYPRILRNILRWLRIKLENPDDERALI